MMRAAQSNSAFGLRSACLLLLLLCSMPCFAAEAAANTSETKTSTVANITVNPLPTGTISGTVTASDGVTPVAGATVNVYQGATTAGTTTTNSSGSYSLSSISNGTYSVEASASGYVTQTKAGVTVNGATTTVNFSLESPGVSYVYDEAGRLVGTTDASGNTALYSYDAVGNLLSISRPTAGSLSVIKFSPGNGPVGTTVIIYGTGFAATASQNTVSFNGVTAVVNSVTSTQIVTSVPSGATTGPITVTTSAGSATSSASFIVGNPNAPTITSFTPTIGTAGTTFTITGTNFDTNAANDKLRLNVGAPAITSVTATSIATSVPTATSSGRVSVATQYGTALSSSDFYIPPSPYTSTDIGYTGRTTLGSSATVSITTSGKKGMLLFDGTAGQRVSFNMTGVTIGTSGCCSANISILKPSGAALVSPSYVGTNGGFINTTTLPQTGTYTIFVDPASSSTGNITFALYNVPPDATGTITPGGSAVTTTTNTPGQNAAITFSATAGQRVSLNMTSVTIGTSSCCSTYVSILKPDGSTLGSQTLVGTNGGFIDVKTLPTAGTYTIFVDPQTTATGSMTLTLYNVPADASGTITAGGSAVTTSTTTPGQNAAITFSATAGQRVSLNMSSVTIGTSSCCSTYVSILKPDGSTLVSPTLVGTNGGFIDSATTSVTGTYTILVDPQGTTTGSMTLTLYSVAADATATITPGGSAVSISTTSPGQNGSVTFSGTAGQRVSLSMTGVTIGTSGCCSAYVSILKPDGSSLVSPTLVGTSGGFIDVRTLPTTGTYTIFVDPQGSTTGGITLTLYDVPADATGTITPGGSAVTKTTTTAGQNASVTFSGTSGQRISLSMTSVTIGSSSCCSAYVSILKPDGSSLVSQTLVGTNGSYFDVRTLPTTGTYTILVDPQGSTTGSITLTLYDVPSDATGSLTIGGSAVGIANTVPGQNARLTFSGTASQQATVHLTSNTMGTVTITLQKPDGTTLTSSTLFGGSSLNLSTQTLPTTGTYTIVFDPSGSTTGSITATVTSP